VSFQRKEDFYPSAPIKDSQFEDPQDDLQVEEFDDYPEDAQATYYRVFWLRFRLMVLQGVPKAKR
jgi:hypothetical protein